MSTDAMQGLVSEAKKYKFSSIGPTLSDDDVVSVWQNVSEFIERNMTQQKGVHITGLGTFTFSQKKLDIGNNKYILIQRPVFMVSEKFTQTHGLQFTKYHTPGQIPIVQLNFAALAVESPFDRDTVESCVKEVLLALNRSINAKRNVEFTFNGIGRLTIRDNRVKMKFYKDFLNSMDGSGRLVDSLKNRPGTVDSVMSESAPSRCHSSNTLILPRITQGSGGLQPVEKPSMPTIEEDAPLDDQPDTEVDLDVLPDYNDGDEQLGDGMEVKQDTSRTSLTNSRSSSRQVVTLAKATGVSYGDDLLLKPVSPCNSTGRLSKTCQTPIYIPEGNHAKPLSPIQDSKSLPEMVRSESPLVPRPRLDAKSPCGHPNAGQELCYLCHQREKRNIPISFVEERQRRENEEDCLLSQYQQLRDTEAIIKDQAEQASRRHESQKIASFNLGVSEAVKEKVRAKPTDFHRSYVFQRRPVTPPRFIKQDELSKELFRQVEAKRVNHEKYRADEKFLERLEQVQLAEDLAAQREQYLRDKNSQQEMYKRALSAQLRFKPLPLPKAEPDSSEPVFGKDDTTMDKLIERRKHANDLYKEQIEVVAQRKRDAILKKLQEQREEEDVLRRTKTDLRNDRANQHDRLFRNRKRLEDDWQKSKLSKLEREREERLYASTPGVLVHEQCDKYHRCGQCKRHLTNCGESNIWCDSRYIPGSRLIV